MNNLIARGKKEGQNSFWVEGNLSITADGIFIAPINQLFYNTTESSLYGELYKVTRDSVALKTGLQDKDDNDIWGSVEIDGEMTEGGSILNFKSDKTAEDDGRICGTMGFHPETASIVKYKKNKGCFYVVGYYYRPLAKFLDTAHSGARLNIYIIGNSYDNIELLEENDE